MFHPLAVLCFTFCHHANRVELTMNHLCRAWNGITATAAQIASFPISFLFAREVTDTDEES